MPEAGYGGVAIAGDFAIVAFDPEAFAEMRRRCGPSAPLGALVHEVGHVLEYARSGGDAATGPGAELVADAWAGCLLVTLGVSTAGVECFLTSTAAQATDTHPPGSERIDAVRLGAAACSR